jgi:hypothetical protein
VAFVVSTACISCDLSIKQATVYASTGYKLSITNRGEHSPLPKKIFPTPPLFPQRPSSALSYPVLPISPIHNYDVATTKLDDWVVMTRPAIEADVRVAKTPAISAENAKREMSPPRLGAN